MTRRLKQIVAETLNSRYAQHNLSLGVRVIATKTLFQADDSTHGVELWITDGTAAGTSFVADIRPGTSGSYPTKFAAAGNKVVFVANDGVHGNELWSTDGTAAGTVLLDDIRAGSTTSSAYGLTTLGSKVVFRANDGVHGSEVWVTDGTASGTVLLKDITPGASGSYPTNFTQLGSVLLFSARGNDGTGLWETDGTTAGTTEIKTIYPGSSFSSSSPITIAGSEGFFPDSDGTHGTELWKTDGTAAGTTMVKDIRSGSGGSTPSYITALGSKVIFAATDTTDGNELWVSDGTSAGTYLLKDINQGTANSNPKYLTAVGNHVLFLADYNAGVSQLWTTDGTSAGTSMIASIKDAGKLVTLGNDVLFKGNDGVHGDELWISDGTVAGTGELADVKPGPSGSYLYGLTAAGDHILFSAEDSTNNFGLWRSNGTAAGTYEISGAALDPSTFFTTSALSCFAQGTRIRTTTGDVAVEQLDIGDLAISGIDGAPAPIRWIGRSRVDPARHPHPWMVYPVRISAGAFGNRLPRRGLLLSPEHAVYVDGVLIPIRHLVNETTIVQEAGGAVTYWHVELDSHGAILAEGLAAESYLDTGNRTAFDNADAHALHPAFAPSNPAAAFAPVIESGPILARVQDRLSRHAERCGIAAPSALEVRIATAGTLNATIPAGVTRIHLVSPSCSPDGDRRRLGAAIGGLTLAGAAIALSAACVGPGFHAVETGAGQWRWTDGKGVLSVPLAHSPRVLTISVVSVAAGAMAEAA